MRYMMLIRVGHAIARGPSVLLLVFVACFTLAATGCGGSGGENPAGNDPDAMLDFRGIIGTWSGWTGTTATPFVVRMVVEEEMVPGQGSVGRLFTLVEEGGQLRVECNLVMKALVAEPPSYRVRLEVDIGGPGCLAGIATMEHHPQTNSIDQDFEAFDGVFSDVVTLTPGPDPGPLPMALRIPDDGEDRL